MRKFRNRCTIVNRSCTRCSYFGLSLDLGGIFEVGDVHKLGGVRSTIKSVIFIISWVFARRAAGISWKGVLVIHIIMGRGRPKGVKDSRPIKVNITQKSKHNNGGNGVTAAAYGERSTTALTFNEQRERGMLPRAALHQKNVISNEQLNRHRAEAGQIAPIFSSLYFLFSLSTWSTLACAFVITHSLRIFAYLSFSLWSCLLECEVNNVYTQQTRHHAHKDGAVENVVKSSK